MAEILLCLTVPGPGLISTGDSAWEGLCLRDGFRQGDEQAPSATFYPSCIAAVGPTGLRSVCLTAFILFLLRLYSHRDHYALSSQLQRPPFTERSSEEEEKNFGNFSEEKLQGLDQPLSQKPLTSDGHQKNLLCVQDNKLSPRYD